LAGVITLCSWVRQFTNTLAMLLSAQVYEWVALNFNAGGNPTMDWHLIHAMETGIYSGSMDQVPMFRQGSLGQYYNNYKY